MKDIDDANLIQTKVFELTREIMSAQQCALAANMSQSDLLQRERDLEAEISKLKDWNAEKQRYHLVELTDGVTAYAVKEEVRGTEPMHHLCTNCYDHGQKSIMQTEHRDPGRAEVLVCHRCGTDLYIHGSRDPAHKSYKRGQGR